MSLELRTTNVASDTIEGMIEPQRLLQAYGFLGVRVSLPLLAIHP